MVMETLSLEINKVLLEVSTICIFCTGLDHVCSGYMSSVEKGLSR